MHAAVRLALHRLHWSQRFFVRARNVSYGVTIRNKLLAYYVGLCASSALRLLAAKNRRDRKAACSAAEQLQRLLLIARISRARVKSTAWTSGDAAATAPKSGSDAPQPRRITRRDRRCGRRRTRRPAATFNYSKTKGTIIARASTSTPLGHHYC